MGTEGVRVRGMSTRILVTGSSGTIGTALTIRLCELGYTVIPVDIRASIWDRAIDKRTIRFDLRKPIPTKRFGTCPDLVIHLAANARVHELVRHPEKGLENYLMTHNILEYARRVGCPRVLFSSSREVYGDIVGGKKRGERFVTPDLTLSPYTASKLGSEGLVHAYAACYGIAPVIVRFSNVYGRYDVSERVVPLSIYNALHNRDITVYGQEKQLDFTWIDDAISGVVRIVKRFEAVTGLTFNIASGKGERIVDLANAVIALTHSQSRVRLSTKRTGEIARFIADISLAKRKLGYRPKVNLQTGLKRTAAWYQEIIRDKRIAKEQRGILRMQGLL